jgi:hypothetical protein
MSALDKMGIAPDLLGRQTAAALAPVLQNLSKTFGAPPKNINEYLAMFKVLAGTTGIADSQTMRTEIKDHSCHINLTNCMWQDIAGIAEKAGYKRCPMCIIGTLNIGFLKVFGFQETTRSVVEKKGNNCSLDLFSD